MTSKRSFWLTLSVVVAALATLAVACVFFTACGDDTLVYAVTWTVSEHADVTVEGYDSLPAEVAQDSELTFTAAGKPGYRITSVKVNGKAISEKDGKYKFVVGADTAVTVDTAKTISSVAVTSDPTTMTYYAGETLDTTGMVVTVQYETGDSETVADYSVVYSRGAAFALGDTSFSVVYEKTTSPAVRLKTAVECKIVIDPDGGTIDDGYYAELGQNTSLHGLSKADDGSVSFSFASLKEPVSLPGASRVTKGELKGDFDFKYWQSGGEGLSSIAVDTEVSTTVKAVYNAHLLAIDAIGYENKTVTEAGKDVSVPYLVITGKFKAATAAYLYLYEGKDKVELVGDEIGDSKSKRDDAFECSFDLRKLVAADYKGKWMDIKFKSTIGGREETMEIYLPEYAEGFVDLEQKLINGNYFYSFQTFEDTLKAVYSDYAYAEYTMTAGTKDGNPTVTFAGNVDAMYKGKTVKIDFYVEKSIEEYAVIGNDLNWSLTFVLDSNFALAHDGYAHFSIIESKDNPTVLYKDGSDGNLLNTNCKNTDLQNVSVGLIENAGAVRCASADDRRVFYVGKGKWGGIVLYGVNEAITGVTLELKNAKPYLVIAGRYNEALTQANAVEILKKDMFAEFQNCEPCTGNGNWDTHSLTLGTPASGETPEVPATILVEAGADGWKVCLDLSVCKAGEVPFVHYGAGNQNLLSDHLTKTTITANGLDYRSDLYTGWGGSNVVVVYITTAAAA